MPILAHPPPPKVRRKSRRQPAPRGGFYNSTRREYSLAGGKSTAGLKQLPVEPDRRRRCQLLDIISDPTASEDNREAAGRDLMLEFPETDSD
jgi:hypothetical protein